MTVAVAQLGIIGSANAQNGTLPAKLPTIKHGTNTTFRSLKQVDAGDMNIGHAEDGPAVGLPVVRLHGWPYDIYTRSRSGRCWVSGT